MAQGDTANARVWVGGDCRTAPLGTSAPADLVTAYSATWKALGLLDPAGLTESRSDSREEKYAWGGILVRTTLSKQKRSFKVIALEDNTVTFDLSNPGSTRGAAAGGISTRTIKTPTPNIRAFSFEITDGSTITRRRHVPRAEVVGVADVKFSETDLEAIEYTIDVYPAVDGTLYIDIGNEVAFQ